MIDNNDKQLIEYLLIIKKGILEGNWEIVSKGYHLITGDSVEPKRIESKVERIHRIMGDIKEDKDDDIITEEMLPLPSDEVTYSREWDNIDNEEDIRGHLMELGVDLDGLEFDDIDEWIDFAKSNDPLTPSNVDKEDTGGKLQVISTTFNKEEADANSKNKQDKMSPRKRNTEYSKLIGRVSATDQQMEDEEKPFRMTDRDYK